MRMYMLLFFVIIGVIPIYLLSYVILNTYEDKAINNRITELQNQGNMLANSLLTTGYMTAGDIPEVDAEITRVSEIYDGRIIIVNNNLNIIKDTYSLEKGKSLISPEVIQCFNGNSTALHDRKNNYLTITYPITRKSNKKIEGVIVMNFSTKDIQDIRESMENRIILFALVLAIIVVVAAVYFSRILTKPLTSVVNSIDH